MSMTAILQSYLHKKRLREVIPLIQQQRMTIQLCYVCISAELNRRITDSSGNYLELWELL